MAHVYIVRCNDGSYYVGTTNRDLEGRIWEHNHDDGIAARFTSRRRPVVLVYAEEFDRVDDANRRERQLHGWSRAKKEALIDGRIHDLRALARRRGGSLPSG